MKIILIIPIFFISLSSKSQSVDKGSLTVTTKKIVRMLARADGVESQHIGEGGEKSEVYVHFEQLLKVATIDELKSLLKHESTIVNVYAYWALAKRKVPEMKALMEGQLQNNKEVNFQDGCIIGTYRVNELYLSLLTPGYIDLECSKLTKEEITQFRGKIN